METAIAARGLTKSYGATRGVVDLSFEVRRGEVFGYLGPNGAGKTTTIRTLLDLIRPTSGGASVFDLDPHRDSVEIHRRTGYLPGEFSLYKRMTGGEYLSYLGSLRGNVESGRVGSLAERLDADLSTRITSLSHGNRQKLALIQAFMHHPELLVLDEPTQGLDPLVQREFHEMLGDARGEGQTVFLSSHVLPEVERACDRVAIIREGRLVSVEDVGDMKARFVRSLEIHFANPPPTDVLADVPGVSGIERIGDLVRCTITGSMDPLVKEIARYEVVDLSSTEPSLEDIFLTYYGPGASEREEDG